jgi:hypothetical protein
LKRHLDLKTHAQAFHAFKDILSMTFTDYQSTAATFNLSANLILNANVQTIKDALSYFFMAKIFPNYNPTVYNLLSDTLQSLNHTQWTLEKIVRYFALKKPSKGTFKHPSKPKDKQQEEATELPIHEIKKKGFFTAQYNRTLYELAIWYIDSAVTYHITCNREIFSSFEQITIPDKIQVASNKILSAKSINTVYLSNGIILYNVRYFPILNANFLALDEL